MRLRRDLLGIVLSFLTVGTFATSVDADAYQELYNQQDRQEETIKETMASEFTTEDDHQELQDYLDQIAEAEKSETKTSLQSLINKEKDFLASVKERNSDKEANVATSEIKKLEKALNTLKSKSEEPFILSSDQDKLNNLSHQMIDVRSSKMVAPVRDLSADISKLASVMGRNQQKILKLVDSLKEANKQADSLAKQKYLTDDEKKSLSDLQKNNSVFFEDADDFYKVETQSNTSDSLLAQLAEKQVKSEKDFKSYEGMSTDLIQSVDHLLSEGKLEADEKDKLNDLSNHLKEKLKLTDYKPGDLETGFDDLQENYDSFKGKSEERIALAKEKEAQEKAEREAQEKVAQEKAAQEKASQQAASVSASVPSPTLNGQWYQAPAGYKFLKSDSGKTYEQVKNPGNFRLITDAEASNYTPGHGNGYAKQ